MNPIFQYKSLIKDAVEHSRVTRFSDGRGGEYPYIILPGLDTRGTASLRLAYIGGMAYMLRDELRYCSVILSLESKGFLVSTPLADKFGRDTVYARKRNYNVPDQIIISQKKAYSDNGSDSTNMYLMGLSRDDNILIVDDMNSSGGSLSATLEALQGFNVVGVGTLFERGDGIKVVREKAKELGFDIAVKGFARTSVKQVDGTFVPIIERFYSG